MPDAMTNAENNQAENKKPGMPLHTKIFIGLVVAPPAFPARALRSFLASTAFSTCAGRC